MIHYLILIYNTNIQMEQIKKLIDEDKLQLAQLDANNKPVQMSFDELERKQKRQNNQGKLYQQLLDLQWDQKYEWVNTKRLHANALFAKGLVDEAIEMYVQSLIGLDLKDNTENRLQRMHLELKYPILTNLSTCFYKRREYSKSIEICDTILRQQLGKNNLKALYKKAYSHLALGQFIETKKIASICLEELDKISHYQSERIGITKKDIRQLINDLKIKNKQEAEMYKNFFKNEEDVEESDKLISSSQKEHTQQILIYKQNIIERTCKNIRRAADCIREAFNTVIVESISFAFSDKNE